MSKVLKKTALVGSTVMADRIQPAVIDASKDDGGFKFRFVANGNPVTVRCDERMWRRGGGRLPSEQPQGIKPVTLANPPLNRRNHHTFLVILTEDRKAVKGVHLLPGDSHYDEASTPMPDTNTVMTNASVLVTRGGSSAPTPTILLVDRATGEVEVTALSRGLREAAVGLPSLVDAIGRASTVRVGDVFGRFEVAKIAGDELHCYARS